MTPPAPTPALQTWRYANSAWRLSHRLTRRRLDLLLRLRSAAILPPAIRARLAAMGLPEEWIAANVPKDERITALSAPAFLPRIDRMGYEVRWVALSDIHRGLVEEDGARWLVVNEGAHPLSDRAYLDGIRAGRFGYGVAYLARGKLPFLRWFDSRRAPGAVSPPIFVLRKRDPP